MGKGNGANRHVKLSADEQRLVARNKRIMAEKGKRYCRVFYGCKCGRHSSLVVEGAPGCKFWHNCPVCNASILLEVTESAVQKAIAGLPADSGKIRRQGPDHQ